MLFLPALAVLALQGQDRIYSGPQKGETTPAFKAVDLSMGRPGDHVDFVSQFEDAPSLYVFVHDPTRAPQALLQALDKHALRRKALRAAFVVLLNDLQDTQALGGLKIGELTYKVWGLRCAVGASTDGKEGPGSWGLNKEIAVTVVLAKNKTVLANWAIVESKEEVAAEIARAIDYALGVRPSSREELGARVAALEAEVWQLRGMLETIQRQCLRSERSRSGGAQDPALAAFVAKLFRPDCPKEEADALLKEIDLQISGKDDLKRQVADALTQKLQSETGTDYARLRSKEYLGTLKQ